jgi:hypothetical protein
MNINDLMVTTSLTKIPNIELSRSLNNVMRMIEQGVELETYSFYIDGEHYQYVRTPLDTVMLRLLARGDD